jgi:NAD(P)-dependent dehydrogenase (short-subunit alcohol dehydrogenase family)
MKKKVPSQYREFSKQQRREIDRVLQHMAHRVNKPVKCYACKKPFLRHLCHQTLTCMCRPCGAFSLEKRTQTADMNGTIGLVTGGRTKIGYACALKLLRAGSTVLVTTRFPCDAANRYAKETDFAAWKVRLHIFGMDFRNIVSVEQFVHYVKQKYPYLDYLIQNAAQTVRMTEDEFNACQSIRLQSDELQSLIHVHSTAFNKLNPSSVHQVLSVQSAPSIDNPQPHQEVALRPDDDATQSTVVAVDDDNNKLATRTNSWYLRIDEVSTLEMLEVQLVNVTAPFLLTAGFKPLLEASPRDMRHIIHVTAIEGMFSQQHKPQRHPHNNMAKAALNMMTLTIANDYKKSSIYVVAVDPGWVDIDYVLKPQPDAAPPLLVEDGAARVLDPIFSKSTVRGVLLKDFRQVDW